MLEYILKKKKKYILILSSGCDYTKSYSEITEHLIANTPKMASNVSDKFELENFRSTVATKSELEVCLYFLSQSKNMEKLSPNCAQLFCAINIQILLW